MAKKFCLALIVVLLVASCAQACRGPADRDWTVRIGRRLYGIQDYGGWSWVSLGRLNFSIPFGALVSVGIAAFSLVGVIGASAFVVGKCRTRV